ncbi:MAG: hypothetical protein H6622_03225 [Halobacteriovoraceae bacterium]|nr:hypothetical protein [Halobacteriovoraceae bacterium]
MDSIAGILVIGLSIFLILAMFFGRPRDQKSNYIPILGIGAKLPKELTIRLLNLLVFLLLFLISIEFINLKIYTE